MWLVSDVRFRFKEGGMADHLVCNLAATMGRVVRECYTELRGERTDADDGAVAEGKGTEDGKGKGGGQSTGAEAGYREQEEHEAVSARGVLANSGTKEVRVDTDRSARLERALKNENMVKAWLKECIMGESGGEGNGDGAQSPGEIPASVSVSYHNFSSRH